MKAKGLVSKFLLKWKFHCIFVGKIVENVAKLIHGASYGFLEEFLYMDR